MITLQQAKKAVEAAEKKAAELEVQITTVVADEHGTIILMSRMDGAFTVSPEYAFAKAYSSATLGFSTEDLAKYSGEGKPYFGLNEIKPGYLTTIAGGLPVLKEGKRQGGVGVGGSVDVNQDIECAKEAIKILLL